MPPCTKTLGEADISASYSADRIAYSQPVRKPFSWRGGLWISVGTGHRPGEPFSAEAYRLAHPSMFSGTQVTYAQKTADAEAARADPNGFYHGMSVKHAGAVCLIMSPSKFIEYT